MFSNLNLNFDENTSMSFKVVNSTEKRNDDGPSERKSIIHHQSISGFGELQKANMNDIA